MEVDVNFFNNIEGVDKNIINYVIQDVFPIYNKNEQGHGIEHIQMVIRRSLKLAHDLKLEVDLNMVFVIAAYHDLGHHIDRKTHEIISAKMFYDDQNMKKFFNDEKRKIIKEAIEDHRSRLDHAPRTIYGKIVSTADRCISDIDYSIKRAYSYGLKHFPEYSKEEQIERVYDHLKEKYGEGGYGKVFLKDEEYENALSKLQDALSNKDEFIERIINVTKSFN